MLMPARQLGVVMRHAALAVELEETLVHDVVLALGRDLVAAGEEVDTAALHQRCRNQALLQAWTFFSDSTRCTAQNTNSSAPMTILVHQELSVPSKAISVWIRPSTSTPDNAPAT